ncbi:hypothetical protein [Streptomyces sp. SBT349]|uniref:hypothetical protein n=1 Tax=Streptomyces sp. SBT349 TaxID=1580539 RepID=UPI00066E291D|nr:hypothetical protein [Streptomyces sp. SBT349]
MRRRAATPLVVAMLLPLATGCGGEDSNPFGEPKGPSTSTALAVGDVFTWEGGVMASVDDIDERSERGEYDSYPEGHAAFTAEVTFDNESDESLSLSDFVFDAVSTADGAEAAVIHIEDVTDGLQGSLEPGASERLTLSWSLDTEQHGRDLTFVATRGTSTGEGDRPEWAGSLP